MANYTGDNVTSTANQVLWDGSNNSDGVTLTSMYVKCVSGTAKIRVPQLHGSTGYAVLTAGEFAIFRVGNSGLKSVISVDASPVITWYGVAAT